MKIEVDLLIIAVENRGMLGINYRQIGGIPFPRRRKGNTYGLVIKYDCQKLSNFKRKYGKICCKG